jgi:TonB family protein
MSTPNDSNPPRGPADGFEPTAFATPEELERARAAAARSTSRFDPQPDAEAVEPAAEALAEPETPVEEPVEAPAQDAEPPLADAAPEAASDPELEPELAPEPQPEPEAQAPVAAAPAPEEASDPHAAVQIGALLNNIYRVKRFIGRGGMGEVYEGLNVLTSERVAIKVILPELAADPHVQASFLKEGGFLPRIANESVVGYRLIAQEPTLRVLYIVTEFVDGLSLHERMRLGPASVDEVRDLMRRLASGLRAAHEYGIVHRDLSPDNVLLAGGRIDRPKIIDFGIAKDMTPGGATIVGTGFAGKLGFVAPEQFGEYDRSIGPWTDVYSLALTVAAVARGKPLDMGGTIIQALDRRAGIPDLSDLPAELQDAFSRMLVPDPAGRVRSMDEVIALFSDRPLASAPPLSTPPVEPTIAPTADATPRQRTYAPVGAAAAAAAAATTTARAAAEQPAPAAKPSPAAKPKPVKPPAGAAGKGPPMGLIIGGGVLTLVLVGGGLTAMMMGRGGSDAGSTGKAPSAGVAVKLEDGTQVPVDQFGKPIAPPADLAAIDPAATPAATDAAATASLNPEQLAAQAAQKEALDKAREEARLKREEELKRRAEERRLAQEKARQDAAATAASTDVAQSRITTGAGAEAGVTPAGAQQKAAACPTPNRAAIMRRPFNADAAYPDALRRREIEGRVVVQYTVTTAGRTSGARIVSADPPGEFDAAVIREVGRMRFEPALKNCQPVDELQELPIRFRVR